MCACHHYNFDLIKQLFACAKPGEHNATAEDAFDIPSNVLTVDLFQPSKVRITLIMKSTTKNEVDKMYLTLKRK
jgi:hypothetical protein